MDRRKLKILQANLGKQGAAQHALMNDTDLRDHAILLVQEPACFRDAIRRTTIAPPNRHRLWQQFLPTKTSEMPHPIRSLIYAQHHTKPRQVAVDSSDITAIEIEAEGREILVISVYLPGR